MKEVIPAWMKPMYTRGKWGQVFTYAIHSRVAHAKIITRSENFRSGHTHSSLAYC